jgi:hypothetical protein
MCFLSRLALVGLLGTGAVGLSSCGNIRFLLPLNPTAEFETPPPSHAAWDVLLKKHVNHLGLVNYRGFRADSLALNAYLRDLSGHLPSRSWAEADRLAYWLNAYNAFTVQRIVRSYPVKSIQELGGTKMFVDTPWDQPFIQLNDTRYSLNDLEYRIIRREFHDSRIHMALVCAAMSCPRLRNEAYTGPRLNEQLNSQARDFVNNTAKNLLTPANYPQVSAIFDFYPDDFQKGSTASVPEFINRYAVQKIRPDAHLTYLKYNWALNEQ